MATKGELISDIELRLSGGKPSDDFEIERPQIGHWLDVTRDGLVKTMLDIQINKYGTVDDYYIVREVCNLAVEEAIDCVDEEYEKMSFTLVHTPMSLRKNMGIVKIVTDEYNLVYPSNVIDINMVSDLPFSKPADDNLVYYSEKNKITVEGLNKNDISDPTFIVYYIPQYNNADIAETDEFLITDDLLGILLDEVEVIGRRELGIPQDIENNGQDNVQ